MAISITPVNATTSMNIPIWDSCESLITPERIWEKCPDNATYAVLSTDLSVKSPLNTGSIKFDVTATPGIWEAQIAELFSVDANLLLDFTVLRPRSIYVMGSKAVQWRIEIVTRENGSDPINWNLHAIARQTVPADTMTEILLDYSSIADSSLKSVAQVNILPFVGQQDFTGYVSGITEGYCGRLSIETNPVEGEVYVNGTSWGTAPQSKSIQDGLYIISFGNVRGYVSPVDISVNIETNQTAKVLGTYKLSVNEIPLSYYLTGVIIAILVISSCGYLAIRRQRFNRKAS